MQVGCSAPKFDYAKDFYHPLHIQGKTPGTDDVVCQEHVLSGDFGEGFQEVLLELP